MHNPHDQWNGDVSTGALLLREMMAGDLPRLMAAVCRSMESSVAPGQRQDSVGVDCGPGCPYCCVLNVSALLPEVAVIARWLTAQLPRSAFAWVRQRLDDRVSRIAWMEEEERIGRQIFCAFLDEGGACVIHPVRPLVCRGVTSLDRNCCRSALEGEGSGAVVMDLRVRDAAEKAFLELASVLESAGLDSRSVELMRGVQIFLADPALAERFLAGERLEQLHG